MSDEEGYTPKDAIRATIQGGTILIEREEMERLQALGVDIKETNPVVAAVKKAAKFITWPNGVIGRIVAGVDMAKGPGETAIYVTRGPEESDKQLRDRMFGLMEEHCATVHSDCGYMMKPTKAVEITDLSLGSASPTLEVGDSSRSPINIRVPRQDMTREEFCDDANQTLGEVMAKSALAAREDVFNHLGLHSPAKVCPDCLADPGWYNGLEERKPCGTCGGGAV